MANTPADIIRQALDILTTEHRYIKLYLAGDEAFGGVAVRWGLLTGLGQQGDDATITVYDMHDSSGIGPGPNGGQRGVQTLVNIREIISITQA